jgi:hypothetical protein
MLLPLDGFLHLLLRRDGRQRLAKRMQCLLMVGGGGFLLLRALRRCNSSGERCALARESGDACMRERELLRKWG